MLTVPTGCEVVKDSSSGVRLAFKYKYMNLNSGNGLGWLGWCSNAIKNPPASCKQSVDRIKNTKRAVYIIIIIHFEPVPILSVKTI